MSNIDGDWSGTEAGQQLEKVNITFWNGTRKLLQSALNMTAAKKVASITPDELLLRTRRCHVRFRTAVSICIAAERPMDDHLQVSSAFGSISETLLSVSIDTCCVRTGVALGEVVQHNKTLRQHGAAICWDAEYLLRDSCVHLIPLVQYTLAVWRH